MKNEKLIERLTIVIKNHDFFEAQAIINDLQTELIEEADKKKTGSNGRIKAIKNVLDESLNNYEKLYCRGEQDRAEQMKFMTKPFMIGQYQIFASPWRLYATMNYTDHETQTDIKSGYLQNFEKCLNSISDMMTEDYLQTAENLKVLEKILKAQYKSTNRKLKSEPLKVNINNNIVVRLDYLIDAILFTEAKTIHIQESKRPAALTNGNSIAIIMPINSRPGNADIFIDYNGHADIIDHIKEETA